MKVAKFVENGLKLFRMAKIIKKVMDQCILPTMTYGCQTWSLNKQMTNKLRTAQRAMERKMLDLKLKDKILCAEIRKRTKIIDIIEYTLKQKWK